MAHQSQDEGFHEIQLNGKQLVFLFMAATVVSVVIFLCGVLVGRGVKAQLVSGLDNTPLTTVADTTATQSTIPAPAAGSDPTTVPPPPAADDLTYFNRLEKRSGTVEQLKPAGDRAAAKVDSAGRGAAAASDPSGTEKRGDASQAAASRAASRSSTSAGGCRSS